MCDCRSYNAEIGTVPEVILHPNDYFPTDEIKSVCVDACIADQIKALWEAGIWTLGSCCGHNGLFGNPSVIIANDADPQRAIKILEQADPKRKWDVKQWQLVDCI